MTGCNPSLASGDVFSAITSVKVHHAFYYTLCMYEIANGDGAVDYEDLMTLTSQWLQSSEQLSADIAPGPSGDGIVDIQDLALFVYYSAR